MWIKCILIFLLTGFLILSQTTLLTTAADSLDIKQEDCLKLKIFQVADVPVWQISESGAFLFVSKMAINADGAPDAYHPGDTGIDALANAGRPGNWWAVVTDTGHKNGTPVIQNSSDPFPGYYISTTSLFNPVIPRKNPLRYVNSRSVPYFVLPENKTGGAGLGDVGVIVNLLNNRICPAIYADVGPGNKIGEGSIFLANKLKVDPDPRYGGTEKGIAYMVFPGSGNGLPISNSEIKKEALTRFHNWGGIERLKECLPKQVINKYGL